MEARQQSRIGPIVLSLGTAVIVAICKTGISYQLRLDVANCLHQRAIPS